MKLPVPPLIARMRAIIYISAILLMTLIPIGAFGHPHVFIDNSISIVFDEHGLAGFGIEWAFDEMFSAMIIHNYDTNKNGKFEAGEIEEIKKGAFSNLRKFDYFIFVKINAQPFKIQFVKNFSTATVEDRLAYRFFIPCHVRAVDSYSRKSKYPSMTENSIVASFWRGFLSGLRTPPALIITTTSVRTRRSELHVMSTFSECSTKNHCFAWSHNIFALLWK